MLGQQYDWNDGIIQEKICERIMCGNIQRRNKVRMLVSDWIDALSDSQT